MMSATPAHTARQRFTLVDWRSRTSEQMEPLYAAESARWASTLEWDTAHAWTEVERGRTLGTVGGVIALDDRGVAAGWSYFLTHDGVLQVGGFVADTDAVAQAIIDWILARPEHGTLKRISLFAFAEAPGLTAMLRGHGLAVERYFYFARDLRREAVPRLANARPWRLDDLSATADLFARAYNQIDDTRPFAPRGGAEAWLEYAQQLTTGLGCGRLLPEASVAVPGGPNRLLAVVLVTTIAQDTAHVAQIAVDPQLQGKQMGSQLLEAACALAGHAGAERMTLLVGGKNARARALYQSARFENRASFISAGAFQPRPFTRVAPGATAMARR